MTFVLGITGGLTIVLKWICPILVRLVAKMNRAQKKRTRRVEPENTIHMTTIVTINTRSDPMNVHNDTVDIQLGSTGPLSPYVSCVL